MDTTQAFSAASPISSDFIITLIVYTHFYHWLIKRYSLISLSSLKLVFLDIILQLRTLDVRSISSVNSNNRKDDKHDSYQRHQKGNDMGHNLELFVRPRLKEKSLFARADILLMDYIIDKNTEDVLETGKGIS
jgi:hypothetical protein